MRTFIQKSLLLSCLGCAVFGYAQAQSDSQNAKDSLVQLSEVTITELGGYSADFGSPGGIGKLNAREFLAAPAITLVPVMNTMAGVRLEERAPASYRVSIRGSSLRAPFGVRNVKIYWNGVPLTEANNTTALNLLDLGNMDQVEVLKGPAGSSFGAGTGGVINFTTLSPDPGLGLRASYTGGSWGTHHGRLQTSWGQDRLRLETRISHLQSQGYRDHSALQRTVGQLSAQYAGPGKQLFSLHALATQLDYQIPGGLNAGQLAENPRQARPRSADQNSSIDQDRLLLNLGYQGNLGPIQLTANTFGYTGTFENPFILDYKQEQNLGGGLRAGLSWDVRPIWNLQLGTELQYSADEAGNYGNVAGVRDTIRFADDIQTTQSLAYLASTLRPWQGWEFTGGLSVNALTYEVLRSQNAFNPADTGVFRRVFTPVLAPRLGLSRSWPALAMHASISYGFSPPTLDEVRTNEGSLNADLAAERGINYEAGVRWRKETRERLAVNLFFFQLEETLSTYTNPDGVVLFRNAGQTRQWGLEVQGHERWAGPQWSLDYRYAYTGHFFNYQTYESRGTDFSGNALPGVAPHTVSHSLESSLWQKLSLRLQHNWTDAILLNDANTESTEPYHWVNAKISYRWWRNTTAIEGFVGVDNLLNQVYSLGPDLNAFGGRFYQPAPGRTFLLGLTVDLRKP